MNVLVLSTMVPFVHGGAEELRDNLVANLRLQGVNAEAMCLPFTWDPPERLIEEMLIARSLRIANVDRLIALKFPAYLVEHENKAVWLLHQYRQAYDLREVGQSNIPDDAGGETLLQAIRRADEAALLGARRLYTNSQVTADRLRHYNKLDGTILPPPVNNPELFGGGELQGYVLAAGRINAGKRQHLLLEALSRLRKGRPRLVVAGPPDTPADAERLEALVARHGLQDWVTLDMRFLPRSEIAAIVNGAAAVAYLPFEEDSPGYVTMEAFQSGKPVLTVADAGGVLDLVVDGVTGWVCPPDPNALAAALARAGRNDACCRRMGAAAGEMLVSRRLTWPATIEKLLS